MEKRIVLAIRHHLYLRNFEHTVRELLDQGFEIQLLPLSNSKSNHHNPILNSFLQNYRGFRVLDPVTRTLRFNLRETGLNVVYKINDYLFYERNDNTQELSKRALVRLNMLLQTIAKSLNRNSFFSNQSRMLLEKVINKDLYASKRFIELIKNLDPTYVLISPLVDFSEHSDHVVRAAKQLGIPVVLLVASWDNLTNKGQIRTKPDFVYCWNLTQQNELMTLHDIPSAKIAIVGSSVWESWLSPEVLDGFPCSCNKSQREILYAGSSAFFSKQDYEYLTKTFLPKLFESEVSSDFQVIFRPHPTAFPTETQLQELKKWPVIIDYGSNHLNLDDDSKQTYRKQIESAVVVFSLNTSLALESVLVGTPSILLNPPYSTEHITKHYETLEACLGEGVNDFLLTIRKSMNDWHALHTSQYINFTKVVSNTNSLPSKNIAAELRKIDLLRIKDHTHRKSSQGTNLRLVYVFFALLSFSPYKTIRKLLHFTRWRKKRLVDVIKYISKKIVRFIRWRKKRLVDVIKYISKKIVRLANRSNLLVRKTLSGIRVAYQESSKIARSPLLERRIVITNNLLTKSKILRKLGLVEILNARLRSSNEKKIVVGPFYSEVGFEILYWIPFLRTILEDKKFEELVIVSRGGTALWYSEFNGTYVDLHEVIGSTEFSIEVRKRRFLKQTRIETIDEMIFEKYKGFSFISPVHMYQNLTPYFNGSRGLRWALKFLKFKAIENSISKNGSEVASKRLLNKPYICLKLYDGGTLDIQNSNTYNILETIITLITEQGFMVVDLNPPRSLDDHDYPHFAEVLRPLEATKPSENLSHQTSLLRDSSGLICSYGGFTYLATALGIKSISIYSSRDTIWEQHQAVAEHARYHLGVESILADINSELDLTRKIIKGGFFND